MRERSNIDVVVLAVHRLGGDSNPVDTEDVAMEASRLAPGRFTWRKYADQISLEHIRVFLSDAKKQKNGALLTGDGSKGWRLSRAGVLHARAQANREVDVPRRQRADRELARRRKIEMARITVLPAWEKFSRGDQITIREAEAVFRIDEYVRNSRREQLIEKSRILFTEDEHIGPFVEAMAIRARERREHA